MDYAAQRRTERAAARAKSRAKYGPELLEELLGLVPALPQSWLRWPADEGFERLRCRLRFSQRELGFKAGLSQGRVSLIEGGKDVRLSEWRRLYAAMGFELVLLPVCRLTVEELEDAVNASRPPKHWLYTPSRPRRRWRLRQKLHAASMSPPGAPL